MGKPFKIIPVLDLKEGLVVRGVRGQREQYRPVQSSLTSSAGFVDVLQAFYEQYGLTEFYIADLDAITSAGRKNHFDLLAGRQKVGGFFPSLMLDAGVRDAGSIKEIAGTGVEKIIIGTETLFSLEALAEIINICGPDKLMVSIDIRDTRIVSPVPELASLAPPEAIRVVRQKGIREFILVQISQVGSREGVDRALVEACLQELGTGEASKGTLFLGGGISGYDDLQWLSRSGAGGALVATILHQKLLDREKVRALTMPEQ
ncbi:HisA/HisF-related TIM barrel protein [Desulfosporosinus lacus]|uniref:Phosphoribosylformimino-5-aminoimidazole carboxamide ribotide isomerase n=1 Tax=Desulfosporosinus lacus DSM 15449 TaxID=1121420 RepID=A0A1M5V485_9FIRM|nr:HisA/HisF-related TIM barrel protein [Desulfosporosinus lacus]SHH69924.1 phosphoribosylformimino-5-aminoimidazole carboxamide ribotide isomerase [Desulfosporosinus lacus DSM 15449]